MAFVWNQKVIDDANRMAGRGLQAGTIYLANCVKEILSVPAPRVTLTDAKGGRYYRAGFKLSDKRRFQPGNYDQSRSRIANESTFKFPKGGGAPTKGTLSYQTAPAIKGEPPRKLSGRLRASVTYEFLEPMKTFEGGDIPTKGRVGTNVKYARRLEFGKGNHEFLNRTLRERFNELQQVLYANATSGGAI